MTLHELRYNVSRTKGGNDGKIKREKNNKDEGVVTDRKEWPRDSRAGNKASEK